MEDHRLRAKEILGSLTAEEKRERIYLTPAYRSAYNELVDIEDRMSVPRYFWRKWVPILGTTAASLYMILRDMSRTDAKTGKNWCWPDQTELGRLIGVKDHKTVRKHLRALEEHGFIKAEENYEYRETWGKRRTSNSYVVFLDLPLTPEDAIELLLREAEKGASMDALHDGKISRHGPGAVDNSPITGKIPVRHDGKNSRALAREKFPGHINVLESNVLNNVKGRNSSKTRFQNHPVVAAMSRTERQERESLAFEISEQLKAMEGSRDSASHQSLGLLRRIAYLAPRTLTRQAITATRDAVDDSRAGRNKLTKGPSAYFVGVVRALAEEQGVDLGIRWRDGTQAPSQSKGTTTKDAQRAPGAQSEVGEDGGSSKRSGMPEAAREALRALLEKTSEG